MAGSARACRPEGSDISSLLHSQVDRQARISCLASSAAVHALNLSQEAEERSSSSLRDGLDQLAVLPSTNRDARGRWPWTRARPRHGSIYQRFAG